MNRESMDELLALSEALHSWGDEDVHRLDTDAHALVERFKDKAFKITSPNGGIVDSIPTWMTGTVAGKVFYFRYRGDTASVRLGLFDLEKATAEKDERVEDLTATYATARDRAFSSPSNAELRADMLRVERSLERVKACPLDTTMPNVVQATSTRENVQGATYAATFASGEAAPIIGDLLAEALAELGL